MVRTHNDEDDEWPKEDEAEPTVTCPYCRREIHEDAQRCPYCEKYISDYDAPPHKPWWILVGVVIALYIIYRWIVG
jgi:hypothetical protein